MTAPPNTPFDLLGASWACPKCKSPKAFFTPTTVEIAGFEDNQAYGFGAQLGLYTILLSPIVYGVWHKRGWIVGGAFIAQWSCNRIAIG